jgi:hypothetical protein
LSRIGGQYEWELHDRLFQRLDRKWGPHSIDRFASVVNRKVPVFSRRFLDPFTNGVDALAQNDWQRHNNYVNAPFRRLEDVLCIIVEQQAVATIIAPMWKGQPWYQKLMRLIIDTPFRLPISRNTFLSSTPVPEPLRNPKWRLYAWRVSGRKN